MDCSHGRLARRWSQRFVMITLIILMAVGNACTFSVPGPWQPTQPPQNTSLPQPTVTTPTTTPTITPQPTPAVELPPALVETDPLPMSEIGPKTDFTFYFNQPMEHGTVQAALQADPSVAGSFAWIDDATVKFTPDKPLPLNTDLAVSFSTRAQAANGLPLSAPVDLSFHTAAGFSLADQLPKPGTTDIDPASAIVATFTRPMVALGADPNTLPVAFTLKPEAVGRGEWLNTSTYIFYPEPALMGGVAYTVQPDPNLNAADGSGWAADAGPAAWNFKTALPRLLTVKPDEGTALLLDDAIVLTFNQAMDPASVLQNLTVKSPAGDVPGKQTWNEVGTELTFQPDGLLQRATQYDVALSAKAQARGGAALGQDFSISYTSVPDFGVAASDPANDGILQLYDVFGGMRVQFTAPLAKQDLTGQFALTPAIGDPYVSNYSGNDVYVSGIFAYNTEYTLTIQPGLQDKWGQSLAEPVVIHFQTPPAEPSLTLTAMMGNGMAFLTPQETSLAGQATNLKTIQVGYAALTVEEFARNTSIYAYERSQKFNGPDLATFSKSLSLPADRNVPVDLPLTSNGKAQPAGLYYYTITSPELTSKASQNPPGVMLVVSRVHLAIKLSQNQLTAWAVNLDEQQPLANAVLAVYTSDQSGALTQVGSMQTDEQGVGQLDYAFDPQNYYPIYVILGQPGDPNFSLAMSTWTEGVTSWDFGLPSETITQKLHTYLYTDRPIYQPGQTVDFKILVHQEDNGRYGPANLQQIHLKVLGEYANTTGERAVTYQTTMTLSDYGTAAGSFTLPEDAAPGYYTFQIDEDNTAILSFQVANYRKPEIELQGAFSSSDLQAGQDVQASLQAKYYFGAPAANLNLHWALFASPSHFAIPGGYQTGPLDTSWLLPRGFDFDYTGGLGAQVTEGQATSGPDGKVSIQVPAQTVLDAVDESRIQHLTLQFTVQDPQELPVSTQVEADLHPADVYLGLRPDGWSGQAKQEADFSVQAVNWQKKPVGDRKLTASFQKVIYQQKADWNWQSGASPFTTQLTPVASTDFQVDAQGQARIAFTPPDPGTYQIELKGGGALTQILFWVGGEGRAAWPVMPSQQIRLVADADAYKPGQVAKILIPNPLGDNTQAWITVERGQVMKTDVVTINGSSQEWDLALQDGDAPNVYVSVLLLGANGGKSPQFRAGYINLPVSPQALELQVGLNAQPQTAAPGGEVQLSLQVKDDQGQPVQGEFSLAVVDKAVLALADPNAQPIQDAFYGQQPLGVQTSLALAVYGRPAQNESAQAPGGRGGGGDMSTAAPVRSNFQDTAYWNGAVQTDANGRATISLQVPDNLTTWVVTARGLNHDLRVGEGTREVVVSKDLLVRPVTPRFLVAGDRIQLAAIVNNNTDQAFPVDVALQATGLDMESPELASQRVDLPAQGRARVSWWVTVQQVDKVSLIFTASGGGLEDATQPSSGNVPVLQYAAPQTYATSGVITEAGQNLEVISAPRSFNPAGGELRVELSPSLAAAILRGLQALDNFEYDSAEPVLSRLLANLETYQAVTKLGIDAPELKDRLDGLIHDSLDRLSSWQNKDGGWGWGANQQSDLYLSAYILFGLGEAVRAGLPVDNAVIQKASDFLAAGLIVPEMSTRSYRLDQLVFQYFALYQANQGRQVPPALYDARERLSPWSRALMAMMFYGQNASDSRVRNLISDLESQAVRSATGAHWETQDGIQFTLGTPVFTTAIVSLALAQLDPAASVLTDAVRYLAANRRTSGCWASTYESAWVLMALTETMSATGELSASFAYSALLNGTPLASGRAGGPNALTPVASVVPLANLNQDTPNGLTIIHDQGQGRLYYRALLQVYRPVEEIQALDRGISINRQVFLAGQDCKASECQPVDSVRLSDQRELEVHLTLTLSQAMYHLVVDDYIPAGAEIVDASLKTSQQPGSLTPDAQPQYYAASDPFVGGWMWWLFSDPKIYNDHIRWTAPYLNAGTYELVYRLTPLQAGEFRLLPAHAYETYFPDVEGASQGAIFRIEP